MPTELRLARFLPYRLSVVANVVSTTLAERYSRQFGLRIPEWRVVAVLAETPDLSANDVAERTAMDKVAVSRAVTALLRAGRIQRRRATDDRRRSHLRLTAEGLRVYRRVVPLALEFEARLLESLTAEERAALDRALERLQYRAQEGGST